VAEVLEKVVNALVQAMQNALISQEAAVQFLKQYIETMQDYITDDPEIPGERERILKTRLLLARLEEGKLLESELEALRKEG
jgi:ribosomal protein L16 Arg81 hydroxylase